MALPDFFLAGAPKAGTAALHAALAQHPSLFMSAVKEPKFFLTDGPPPTRGGPGDVKTYREHVWRQADYEAVFDPAPAGQVRGESTPFYLHNRDAQRRIRALIPDAKLIVVLRDPVERAHSNWAHLCSAGLDPVDNLFPLFEADIRLLETITGEDFGDWLQPRGDSGGLVGARSAGQRQARNGQPRDF